MKGICWSLLGHSAKNVSRQSLLPFRSKYNSCATSFPLICPRIRLFSDTPFDIVWHTDSIKCLGVWIGYSSNVCTRNWRDATDKFYRVLQRWSGRALSFAGRSTVVKSFAAAKLWHIAHVVPPQPGVVADIIRKNWSFIWHNMITLARRPVCTFPTTAGELGALDFDLKVASLHILWIGRLPLDDPSKWLLFARFWLDRVTLPFEG